MKPRRGLIPPGVAGETAVLGVLLLTSLRLQLVQGAPQDGMGLMLGCLQPLPDCFHISLASISGGGESSFVRSM